MGNYASIFYINLLVFAVLLLETTTFTPATLKIFDGVNGYVLLDNQDVDHDNLTDRDTAKLEPQNQDEQELKSVEQPESVAQLDNAQEIIPNKPSIDLNDKDVALEKINELESQVQDILNQYAPNNDLSKELVDRAQTLQDLGEQLADQDTTVKTQPQLADNQIKGDPVKDLIDQINEGNDESLAAKADTIKTLTINVTPEKWQSISLVEAVSYAIQNNPDVIEAWKNYQASLRDKYVAYGGYLPTLDWSLSQGREKRDDPALKKDYNRTIHSLTLKQMLFDGFATSALVEQFDATTKSQLMTLEDVTNRIALEASRAYINLLRQRSLTDIAENNYVDLKILYEQVVLKAQSGVGKKSDVEQALARLALADYNMTVEGSLIHDAEAEFQRVVGFLPPEQLDPAIPFKKDIPDTPELAIIKAQSNNPLLISTMYVAEAQKMTLRADKSSFMPRVDLQLSKNWDKDLNGISTGDNRNDGQYNKEVAEVILTWNLFNGRKDYHTMQKDIDLLVANDKRIDSVCRNLRQETSIFYNNILKLTEQESYLDSRQLAIEKAREAYRKQFAVGQRTLIDLLNSEEELFESKRLYTGVVNDLSLVYAETHNRMGTLVSTLGLKRYQDNLAPSPDRPDYQVCIATAPKPYEPDRKILEKRVLEGLGVERLPSVQPKNLDADFDELIKELE